MTRPCQSSWGVITLVTAGLTAVLCGPGYAEPSPHYANTADVLPAPVNYGRAHYTAGETAIHSNDRGYQTYQRTYSASGGEAE